MKLKNILILVCFVFLFSPALSYSKYQIELTPSISVSEEYDDNIYLTNTGERSDYITIISPSILLNMVSQKGNLGLTYTPSYVMYSKEDEKDTFRHAGNLALDRELTQHIRFNLTDAFIRTEDPIEGTEGIDSIRNTRNTYWRNTFNTDLQYVFGTENLFSLAYNNSKLENEDITLNDGTIHNPSADLAYWFDIKNGIDLNVQYIKADFSRDDGTPAGDDYRGHGSGIRYIRRFNPHTTGSIHYGFSKRDFDGLSEDYKVHEGTLGFDHSFSEDLTVSLSGGFFIQNNETSDDDSGYSYNLLLTRRFDRGSISIGGQGGWREAYLEAERRGFTKYQGFNANFEYQVMETLTNYAAGAYTQNKDPSNRKWNNIRINYGFRYTFLRWFTASLDYSYQTRDDDMNTGDYDVNRVMLIITAARLFRY